ncbi:MAG: helicase-associated domain-containing protein [Candidatus Promineifilaceae bacterium]
MYDTARALSEHELPTLRIIGEWYELDLTGQQKNACVKALAEVLSLLDMSEEIIYLPPEEHAAFLALIESGGRMQIAKFEREFGTVRQMGPGRLEREEPWLDPVSPAEALWYRGFLYRDFDDSDDSDLEEYYYLPTELKEQFPSPESESTDDERGLPQIPYSTPESFYAASDDAVDDLTALLAAAQNEPLIEDELSRIGKFLLNDNLSRLSLLYTLAWELKLLRPTNQGAKPTRKVVEWLRSSRTKRRRDLVNAWLQSSWSELFHTPGIECEAGRWEHDPKLARRTLLDFLPKDSSWYRLYDLISSIKENEPDFQRPGSNYDTWYIRDKGSGEYLVGFQSWDQVEGNQLAYTMRFPLYWLGLIDLNSLTADSETLFRLNSNALAWLAGSVDEHESVEVPIVVRDDATIVVPFNANAYHRFQVARVADAEKPEEGKPFIYRLSPSSLERAQKQGIEPSRVLKFLEDSSGRPIPPSTHRAVERWDEFGTEGRLDKVLVLRVRDGEILNKLRANPKTQPYIAETLGELAVAVRAEDRDRLRSAAAQLGLLLDDIVIT